MSSGQYESLNARVADLIESQRKAAEEEHRQLLQTRRAQKVARVKGLSNFLYRNGSCSLVLLNSANGQEVKDGLAAQYGKDHYFLDAKGSVQGQAKEPRGENVVMDLLTRFRERTGKDGLIIVHSFRFGQHQGDGSPAIRGFFERVVNTAAEPQVLVMGRGTDLDLPTTAGYRSSPFIESFTGVASLLNGVVSFHESDPEVERQKQSARLHEQQILFGPTTSQEAQEDFHLGLSRIGI